jgi:putative flavoprotein involved in K+ transport
MHRLFVGVRLWAVPDEEEESMNRHIEEQSQLNAAHLERFDTVIIGGGQAGLATGYHLAQRDLPFVILDANQRIGDAWRKRWDSLRLFTPARYDGLQGWRFPAPALTFPTKDEMADYLEAYAARFELPVRTGVKVDGLSREGDRFIITSGSRRFEAKHVVVATGAYQVPKIPSFADDLRSSIMQLHSSQYRHPSQIQEGAVLVVGAGNSGAEIAFEVSCTHPTYLSGKPSGRERRGVHREAHRGEHFHTQTERPIAGPCAGWSIRCQALRNDPSGAGTS